MNEPEIRDLFRVMIVDHNLDHIREMQKIDFAKQYQIKPYFVYYGDEVEQLPEGVRHCDTLESLMTLAKTKNIEGLISRCRKKSPGVEDVEEDYGLNLAKAIRDLEKKENEGRLYSACPIYLYGAKNADYNVAPTPIGFSCESRAINEFGAMQNLLTYSMKPGTKLKEGVHIVTNNLPSGNIGKQASFVRVTEFKGLSEAELAQHVRMLPTGVDGIMLGVSDSSEIEATLAVANAIQKKVAEKDLQCTVSLVWKGTQAESGNQIPDALAKGAKELGVHVFGKHGMAVEAKWIEEQKKGAIRQ